MQYCVGAATQQFVDQRIAGLISSARGIGIRRSSVGRLVRFLLRAVPHRFLRCRCRGSLTSPPPSWQASGLRAPIGESGSACGFRRDAREAAADLRDCLRRLRCLEVATRLAGLASCLRRGEMRFETVVAEAQRKQIRGTAECGVGSTPVGSRNQHRALIWGAAQKSVPVPLD